MTAPASDAPSTRRAVRPIVLSRLRGRSVDLVAPVATLLAVVVHLPALGDALIGEHAFRQTQTAYPTLLFAQRGIDLLNPPLPVLGPPYEVPFELPLYQAIAALLMRLGLSVEVATRLEALAWFAVTGLLVWALVRRLAGPLAGACAGLAFVLSPFGLFWAHAALIEYMATAAAVGFGFASLRFSETHARRWLAAALVLGVVGSLVKITTWAFWVPLAVLVPLARRDRVAVAAMLGVSVVAAGVGLAWTAHADAIKAASVWTAPLTSSGLFTFNFGTIAQRLDPSTWLRIAFFLGILVVGVPGVVLAAAAVPVARRSPQAWAWLGVAVAAIAPIVVLFNLYWLHDYYLAAVSPAWAAIVGLGLAALVARGGRVRVTAVALAVASIVAGAPYWTIAFGGVRDPANEVAQAAELDRLSTPTEDVVVEGNDWSPEVLFYGRRTGYALPFAMTDGQRLSLAQAPIHVFLVSHPDRDRTELLRLWPWTGVAGAYTYLVGHDAADVAAAPIVASDSRADETTSAAPRLELQCDAAPLVVPASGPVVIAADDAPPGARVRLLDGYAPVPVRSTIVVRAAGELRLSCSGAPSVVLESRAFGGIPGSSMARETARTAGPATAPGPGPSGPGHA